MKLLVDETVSQPIISFFKNNKLDVIALGETSLSNSTNDELITYANMNGYLFVSQTYSPFSADVPVENLSHGMLQILVTPPIPEKVMPIISTFWHKYYETLVKENKKPFENISVYVFEDYYQINSKGHKEKFYF